jgi:hypothetical protein
VFIKKLAINALMAYPTTLEEDLTILEHDKIDSYLSLNQQNCLIYRINEKKVLHFLRRTARRVDKLL